ncbi:MAG: hypothetical protein IKI17_03945 [Oscillospiraceae bacterium]|nr:hypothetical protein [Oscillospiraceae bacterium]
MNTDNKPDNEENSTSSHASESSNNPSGSGSTSNIANAKKSIGAVLIVLGLFVALLGGCSASKLSDSAKPLSIESGYTINGKTVITDRGTIGGNSQAVSTFNGLKYFFIIAGIAFVIGGIVLYSKGKSFETIPTMTKHGRIIDLDIVIASVEFDDGSRERLQYRPTDFVLVIGDRGTFYIKNGMIVSFIKD